MEKEKWILKLKNNKKEKVIVGVYETYEEAFFIGKELMPFLSEEVSLIIEKIKLLKG